MRNHKRLTIMCFAFSVQAALGQGGVPYDISLVPTNPGPYTGGESFSVDVFLNSPDMLPHNLRFLQLDTRNTTAISLTSPFSFSVSPFNHAIFTGLPLPAWADTYSQPTFSTAVLLAQEPYLVGAINVMLPTTVGMYTLDVLNGSGTLPDDGAQFSYGFGSAVDEPVTEIRAINGEIVGGTFSFDVIFIDCNGNGISDSNDITSGTSPDNNGNGIPDECELQSPSAPPAPDTDPKSKFITFVPNNIGLPVNFRVTVQGHTLWALPCRGDEWRCTSSPQNLCNPNDVDTCDSGNEGVCLAVPINDCEIDQATNNYALLVNSPPVPAPNWDSWDVVHVTGCEVQPTYTYDVSATVDGNLYSPSLSIATTQLFADVALPIGELGISDIIATINLQNGDYIPYTTPDGDLNEVPDGQIDISDIITAINANTSSPQGVYPHTPLEQCP